jgi:hypothetical protein
LGDLKTITINWGGTTEEIDMEIVGFSHDTLSDDSGTASITFFSKQLLNTVRAMSSTTTNAGGWGGVNSLRSWCNTELYNALPPELKNVLKEVKKLSDGGYGSASLTSTNDKCWLASIDEMYHWNGDNTVAGQGTRYPQTTNHDSGINGKWSIKAKVDGTTNAWWLRTAATNNSNCWKIWATWNFKWSMSVWIGFS